MCLREWAEFACGVNSASTIKTVPLSGNALYDKEIHGLGGNLALADGSVRFTKDSGVRAGHDGNGMTVGMESCTCCSPRLALSEGEWMLLTGRENAKRVGR